MRLHGLIDSQPGVVKVNTVLGGTGTRACYELAHVSHYLTIGMSIRLVWFLDETVRVVVKQAGSVRA